MVRLSWLGELVVVIAVWALALVLLAQIAPDWSSTLQFMVGMGAALVGLRVARAAVERSA